MFEANNLKLDIKLFNTLIDGLELKYRDEIDIMNLFEIAKMLNLEPNEITYTTIVNGHIDPNMLVYLLIEVNRSQIEISAPLYNDIAKLLFSWQSPELAIKILGMLCNSNKLNNYSYVYLIEGLFLNEMPNEAFLVYLYMAKNGISSSPRLLKSISYGFLKNKYYCNCF